MRRMIAAVLVSLAVSGPAWGGFETGNSLHAVCEKGENKGEYVNWGSCMGYIESVADSFREKSLNGMRFCLPKTVTGQQIAYGT